MRDRPAAGISAHPSISGVASERNGSSSAAPSAASPTNAPVTSKTGTPRSGSGTSGIGGRLR